VVPTQLHCAPLAPFVFSSAMVHDDTALMGAPLTVACNVTWPLAGIVTAGGETVTVTFVGIKPATTITASHDNQQDEGRDVEGSVRIHYRPPAKDHLNIDINRTRLIAILQPEGSSNLLGPYPTTTGVKSAAYSIGRWRFTESLARVC